MIEKSITRYISINFLSLSPGKENEIKNNKPIPNLSISETTKSISKEFIQKFNSNIYKKQKKWLFECQHIIFFSCILFSRKSGDGWIQNDINDLAYLRFKIMNHEQSSINVHSHLNLNVLGKQHIIQ